jgi:hypothetical protein
MEATTRQQQAIAACGLLSVAPLAPLTGAVVDVGSDKDSTVVGGWKRLRQQRAIAAQLPVCSATGN